MYVDIYIYIYIYMFVCLFACWLEDGMDLALALPRLARQTCHRLLVLRPAGPDRLSKRDKRGQR